MSRVAKRAAVAVMSWSVLTWVASSADLANAWGHVGCGQGLRPVGAGAEVESESEAEPEVVDAGVEVGWGWLACEGAGVAWAVGVVGWNRVEMRWAGMRVALTVARAEVVGAVVLTAGCAVLCCCHRLWRGGAVGRTVRWGGRLNRLVEVVASVGAGGGARRLRARAASEPGAAAAAALATQAAGVDGWPAMSRRGSWWRHVWRWR